MPIKRVNCIAFAEMMSHMMDDEPRSRLDLMRHTGLHKQTIDKYIAMLKKKKVIYVSGWIRFHPLGVPREAYSVGRKKNVPRPPRISAAESMRNTRLKRKKLENVWKGVDVEGTNLGVGRADGHDVANRHQAARSG